MKENGKKIFWGVVFVLAAVYMIVSRIYELPKIGLWTIILTIAMIAIIIKGIGELNFFEILFGAAFLCCIYDSQLGIEELTPWPVLGAALLGSIGLSMIFHKKKRVEWTVGNGVRTEFGGSTSGSCDGANILIENNFGSANRYINSENFCSASIKNNFGSLNVYFDNAIIQSGAAYVDVESGFGSTNLYCPREWNIVNDLSRSFGTINEYGKSERSSSNSLYIRGEANFGTINIYYI